MIAYIKGILEEKNNEVAVIDVNGVGYQILIPYSTYQLLPEVGTCVKLNIYMNVREDNVSLFGFFTKEEERVFKLLISVSGVGPKMALAVLSDITPAEFSLGVITDDVSKLTKVSGIGKKTAQRIILELKDKLKNEDMVESKEYKLEAKVSNNQTDEAISALQVLGYPCKDATKAVNAVDTDGLSVEEIIKAALKLLI